MDKNENLSFDEAAIIIKDAIIRSRYQAAKLVNKELLGLYYAVGRYVSDNSRVGTWGREHKKQSNFFTFCDIIKSEKNLNFQEDAYGQNNN